MKFFKRLIQLLVVVIILINIAYFVLEKSFIYYPNSEHITLCDLPNNVEVVNPEESLTALYTSAKQNKLLIFFHGNAGSACSWRYLGVNHARSHGYDTLVVEYPGYSGLGGTPSKVRNSKMLGAIARFIEAKGYTTVVSMGFSLGAGLASEFAGKYGANAVILFAPYDRISRVVQSKVPFITSFIMQEDYQNDSALKNFKNLVTIVHGKDDPVISTYHSEILAKGLSKVDRVLIPGGHNAGFENAYFNALLKEKLP